MNKCLPLFFLLFLFLSPNIKAQRASALDRVDSLTQLGEYKNAIRLVDEFLKTAPRNFARSQAYYRLSKAHLHLNELDLARDYNKESQSIKERIGYEYFADNVMQSGLIALAAGNPAAALDYFEEAATLPHETVLFSAQLERNTGLAYLDLSNTDAAEQSFTNALDYLQWEVGAVHEEVAGTYVSLGRLETHRGDWLKALKALMAAQSMLTDLNVLRTHAGTGFYNAVIEWNLLQEGRSRAGNKRGIHLSSLRKQLGQEETLLLLRSNSLYFAAMAISTEEEKVVLEDYSRKMRSSGVAAEDYISLPKPEFVNVARQYFDRFIAPVSSVLDKTKQLTIIRYDEVSDLELAALLRQPVTTSKGYTDFPFLLKAYSISYELRISDFKNRTAIKNTRELPLRFAVDFPQKYKRKVSKRFRKYRRKGSSRSEALRSTQLWMMDRKEMAAPSLWLSGY